MYFSSEILSAKVEFLAQFNVTKHENTGIEYIEQMHVYVVGSLMLKSIFVMCFIKHLTERSISSNG